MLSIQVLRKHALVPRQCRLYANKSGESSKAVGAESTSIGGPTSPSDKQSSTSLPSRRLNWLERDCGDPPSKSTYRERNEEIDEMMRGGFAIQKLNERFIAGQAFNEHTVHDVLLNMQATEKDSVGNMAEKMGHYRSRPSFIEPFLSCFGNALGAVSGTLGNSFSAAYTSGIKFATSDYYNDQIREIYARMPQEVELKDLFKKQRDIQVDDLDAVAKEKKANTLHDLPQIEEFSKRSTQALVFFLRKV